MGKNYGWWVSGPCDSLSLKILNWDVVLSLVNKNNMSNLQAMHSLGHRTRYFIIDEWMDLNKGIVHKSFCQEKFKHFDPYLSLILFRTV